ncbi:Hemerythrin HHE cation binding domain-containing protein [Friedmanniella luteola]|uniref:Hemerythrin HHE cation binding domain-containing protein n=1 Tax=Friedmanniella luteola TaxID=546871 RepID=A0A1H1W8Y0_9ACTN|nr:hemerythrin domain-containing protein [Friedmanniella luteola]SDS93100.1 Hemerythrin HHE cation binding domain-containing protein [Friedmanniella luteola]
MADTRPRATAWAAQLRAVHVRLREALELARDALERGATPSPGQDLHVYCVGFCAALSGHHRAEDGGLFPAIEQEHPQLADTLRYLRQDHAQLEHLLGSLAAAVERGEPTPSLLRHLGGVEAIMESHFRYEERQLLGVLDGLDLDLDLDRDPQDLLGPLA